MKIRILLYIVILLISLPADAQRRRKAPARSSQPTREEQEQLERQKKMEKMTAATAKIMFIDSIVVHKKDFLSQYKLNPETGYIKPTNDFLKTKFSTGYYAYQDRLGTMCYFAQHETDTTSNLYVSEALRQEWSRPELLKGINEDKEFMRINYPYMMGDGQKLYFAAESKEGLGGYDIYTATYDIENHQFRHPSNIGMPFNSEGNDYMFVIDEYDNLGWFATDRNQSADSVCIYVFIPSSRRQTYRVEDYTPEQIARFARIHSIAETWDNEHLLRESQAQLQSNRVRKPHAESREFSFVINDDVVYHQMSDFRVPENQQRFKKLASLLSRRHSLVSTLSRTRQYYATVNQQEKDKMRPEMLDDEQKLTALSQEIHMQEKTIRNTENIYITKNK